MDFTSETVQQQMLSMLSYQCALNDKLDPNWRDERRSYLRAAMVEGAEMVDHHGYKWWKKQEANLGQVELEVVDIIHFYLSEVARVHGDDAPQSLIEQWLSNDQHVRFDEQLYRFDEMGLLEKIDLLVGLSAAKRLHWGLFRSIMLDLDFSFESLYRQYAGKNVLNLFRLNNGYQDGSYIKQWGAEEDNEHLTQMMSAYSGTLDMDQLYGQLDERYRTLTQAG